jgi:hypothetical protein
MQIENETLKIQINYQIERNLTIVDKFVEKLHNKRLQSFDTMKLSDSLFEAAANLKVYNLLLEQVNKGASYKDLCNFCDKNALKVTRDGSRSTSETANMSKHYLAKAWSNACVFVTG